MLQRLHELKPFCVEHQDAMPDLKLPVNDWLSLKDMIDSLQPARDGIIFLQKHDITMGDFFGCWWKIISKLKKKNSLLSNCIAKSMEKRQKALFENPIYSSALFMDPRFQCLLNDSSKIEAKDHLQKTWRILELLLINENEANTNNVQCNVAHEENVMDFDDDLESFIQSSSQTNENMSININSSQRSIGILLEEYDNIPRMHHSIDIKKYWTERLESMPELYKLSQVVMAVPCTQVSVERSFSGLKFILSDLRTSLSPDLLENIMIIRGNNFSNK
ncbi:unnamed protein product [Macrosiphum euphorbiae]|nr:unnamed protein product [Macrosiphum euphorbiae]